MINILVVEDNEKLRKLVNIIVISVKFDNNTYEGILIGDSYGV